MKNDMQLKAIIKNIAKNKNISASLVLQNYMLERFLERVSLSKYRDNYIIKGGFLLQPPLLESSSLTRCPQALPSGSSRAPHGNIDISEAQDAIILSPSFNMFSAIRRMLP